MRPRRFHALCFSIALVVLAGCSESGSPTSVPPGELISLTASASSIPADGVSRVTLTAQIPANASSGNRTVTFTSTSGTLVGGAPGNGGSMSLALQADVDGRATAQLQSPTLVGAAQVTAAVSTFLQTLTIAFSGALPDRILVDPGAFSLQAGLTNSTTVTATLRRGSGIASQNTVVEFRALTSAGARLGEFRSVTTSSASGTATALFTAGETAFRGTATIFARVTDVPTSTVVEGSATIQITEPPVAP